MGGIVKKTLIKMTILKLLVSLFLVPYVKALLDDNTECIKTARAVRFMFWNTKYKGSQQMYCCKSALPNKCEREDMIYYKMWDVDEDGNKTVIGGKVWDASGWMNALDQPFPTIPKFDPKKPTIIVAHGLGGCTSDQQFADDYKRAGKDYNVIGIR